MDLFAPSSSTSNSLTSRQTNHDLAREIQNTIDNIRSEPYSLSNTVGELKKLNVSAQNSAQGNSASTTHNSAEVATSVDQLKLQPGDQRELFDPQQNLEVARREALRVNEEVIRRLQDLLPESETVTTIQAEAKPKTSIDPQTDPSLKSGLISDINLELEKLGFTVTPNESFLESSFSHDEKLRKADAGLRSWMKGAGLKLSPEEEALTETLSAIPNRQPREAPKSFEEQLLARDTH